MKKYVYYTFLALALGYALMGCATGAKAVKLEMPPAPAQGEAALFGKVQLLERVNKVYLPVDDHDGALYLHKAGTDKTYRIAVSDSGDFGVYLPSGDYEMLSVSLNGYDFRPGLKLTIPEGQPAAYAGTLVLDGTPTGALPGSETSFVFTVRDEYRQFVTAVRKAAPTADVKVARSLLSPAGGVAPGSYPDKVHRAKDVKSNLSARTDAVEEVVGGILIALPYYINPVWLFTLPF